MTTEQLRGLDWQQIHMKASNCGIRRRAAKLRVGLVGQAIWWSSLDRRYLLHLCTALCYFSCTYGCTPQCGYVSEEWVHVMPDLGLVRLEGQELLASDDLYSARIVQLFIHNHGGG